MMINYFNEIRGDHDLLCDSFIYDLSDIVFSLMVVGIYKHPSDYPEKYVARVFDVESGNVKTTKYVMTGYSLESIRSRIPARLVYLQRSEFDDKTLVETWI